MLDLLNSGGLMGDIFSSFAPLAAASPALACNAFETAEGMQVRPPAPTPPRRARARAHPPPHARPRPHSPPLLSPPPPSLRST